MLSPLLATSGIRQRRRRSSALRYALRELIANPSGSRTIGQLTISTGKFRSRTICRITASCAASFCPKKQVGLHDVEQLADNCGDTLEMPGRERPSRRSLISATSTAVLAPAGYMSSDARREEHIDTWSASSNWGNRARRSRILAEVFGWAELQRIDENRNCDAVRMFTRHGVQLKIDVRREVRPWWEQRRPAACLCTTERSAVMLLHLPWGS